MCVTKILVADWDQKASIPRALDRFYPKFNFVKQNCEIIVAAAYAETPEIEVGFKDAQGVIPSHKALHVRHLGSYNFLSNAWSTVMNTFFATMRKSPRSVHNYEIYRTFPDHVAEADHLTDIYRQVR